MAEALSYLSLLLLISGGLFILIGSIGMLKMKSFWLRVHVASLIDVPGIILVLAGILFYLNLGTQTFKILLLIFLILITGPVTIYMMCQTLRLQTTKQEKDML